MQELFCKNCGGTLQPISEEICKCENCGSTYAQVTAKKQQELLDSFLDKQKQEQLNSLRRHLWQEATAKFIDSEKIVSICLNIKNIYPEDFLANFYEVVCGQYEQAVIDFIDNINVKEHYEVIEPIVNFLIKSLKSEYLLCVNNLIERAYKGSDLQTYNRLTTAFATQAELVEEGVYELNLPRDVFVAYSSADMGKVQQIVTALEEEGLTCFVAMRNLQHGVGAVNNYQQALEKAIDNSKIFLFISSKNSRNFKCDAIKHELPYLKKSDLENLRYKFPNLSYDKINCKYKKPRIQLRLDDTKSMADGIVNEIFAGLEYCYDIDGVKARIMKYMCADDCFEEDFDSQKQIEEQKRFKKELEQNDSLISEKSRRAPSVSKNKQHALNNVKVGDYIKFGKYPQSDASTKEDIEWLVLDKQGSGALLISKYALDCKQYHDKFEDITWANCSLRKWLNNEFFNNAFSVDEKTKISTVLISAGCNPVYGTKAGKPTEDKVNLLTISDVNKHFNSDTLRICKPTAYAKQNGLSVDFRNNVNWWLCTPGHFQSNASYVHSDGHIHNGGSIVNNTDMAVRPVIWIELDAVTKQDKQEAEKTNLKAVLNPFNDAKVGGYIKFGKYPQSDASIKEDIEWLLLEKQEDKVLLISKYALDCKPYNSQDTNITWERCTLRKWLNNEFLNSAFNSEEQLKIQLMHVSADKNPLYNRNPGNSTNDKMFLLSLKGAKEHFEVDEERACKPTAFARENGAYVDGENCMWWIRTPGSNQNFVGYVNSDGKVKDSGKNVNLTNRCVRPAMWVTLD